MTKKNYIIVGATILVFAIAIIAILISGKKETWSSAILEADSYQITMTDCKGREKTFDNNVIHEILNKWDNLSNNGPWTSKQYDCYKTLTFTYEKNGIIRYINIIIVDETSIVLDLEETQTYYTNAEEMINYLESLFIA